MEKNTHDDGVRKVNIRNHRRWSLAMYDFVLLIFSAILILGFNPSSADKPEFLNFALHLVLLAAAVFSCRVFVNVYKQIWRYGGAIAYIRLIAADALAGIVYHLLQAVLPIYHISFIRSVSLITFNLLLTICIRLVYQHMYECARRQSDVSGWVWKLTAFLTGLTFETETHAAVNSQNKSKIRIAIVGAGRIGVMLAEELLNNVHSEYVPCCFIDADYAKAGREVFGLPVLPSDDATLEKLSDMLIQEIVFALPNTTSERKKELYDYYKQTGCKVKVYDFPVMQTADNGKRFVREFDIEDLLFRQPVEFHNEKTARYYKDKVVLITGGGGSIGSELCRQIAQMHPKRLIILDIYENEAYNLQQELRIAYGNALDLHVEIVSICDRDGLEKVFATYRPNVLLHAAAHKHVPLMEHNCCEAVKNNVFGTLHVVELSEKYNVERFIMISTDKAVNPTNVMGATKRMCEMLVQSYSCRKSSTTYSVTRFGNVLGSHGSVIPLFKNQIMHGGPVTLTDFRIIRYFMTIPEASQLVLESGALAKNGELFVLDMGKPIKILELAENMIRLSGYEPYKDIQIVETGLRPGEKLYEELLIRSNELTKTDNDMIFIEHAEALPCEEIAEKMDILRAAVATGDNAEVKKALLQVVPTYREPDEVNDAASDANEMKLAMV